MTDKIEKMTDDAFKKIMQSLGMPDSMSLYAALKQVENHTWQAAQSVAVVGEPVAWGVTKRYEDNVWFISDSRFTAQHYASQYAHRIGAEPDQVVLPLYTKPTTSITAQELASLRARLERAEDVLRTLASDLGAGGYNAESVDAEVFEHKIRNGVNMLLNPLINRLEQAEKERDELRKACEKALMAIAQGKGE